MLVIGTAGSRWVVCGTQYTYVVLDWVWGVVCMAVLRVGQSKYWGVLSWLSALIILAAIIIEVYNHCNAVTISNHKLQLPQILHVIVSACERAQYFWPDHKQV